MTFRSYVLSLVILALFGWTMITFYNAAVELKESIVDSGVERIGFSVNLFPFFLFLIAVIPAGIAFTRRQRKDKKGWIESIFFPSEFRERDEREKALTSKASRNVYISMMIVSPLLVACMLFQPLVSDYFPAYPVAILMLFPIIQLTVFYLSLRKKRFG